MSIRRSLALVGAAALTSSLVLAGAQGAVAVGATASPSAAAPQADKSAASKLNLSLDGVPGSFIAGGKGRMFTYEVENKTKHDFVLYPLLKFKSRAGELHPTDLKVEYQLPGEDWRTAVVAPDASGSKKDAVLILLGGLDDSGNPQPDALLGLNRGKTLKIDIRATFTEDAPLGKAGVVPAAYSAQLDDDTHLPVDNGNLSCEGGSRFVIKAQGDGGGGGKPSPTPTHSGKPSPTPSQTGTPTPSGTTTPTETVTPTPTQSATKTPTTPATTPATTPSPAASTTGDAGGPIDFPVEPPVITPPKLPADAVTKAKSKADAGDKALAQTGGGDNTTVIAAAGAAVLAAGAGTLVVLRRRKASGQQG
ncbi:LAETG motif-containing sortase-dependent surface protein [Streptomyces sp. NRRL WC-3742]|uniref:LAETG motif-containing sortase-dependent surface protein n=1 Tax=Streptomyces sp. NRRL WC-3742 TaxID=1463934 RepID=UPI0004C8A552|nr:LAETG motif-containing sortase-dependent surface protein [Streptomyces sp. NRRL WC-3742]